MTDREILTAVLIIQKELVRVLQTHVQPKEAFNHLPGKIEELLKEIQRDDNL